MKYIIYVDIDGTVYPFNKKIHPQTFKDIKAAQNKNIEVVLCTGNPYLDNVEKLAKKLEVRYCITSNGASIFDRTEKQFIYESTIPQAKAQKILDFSIKNKISTDWWNKEKIYFNEFVPQKIINMSLDIMSDKKNHEINCKKINGDIFKIEFYDEPNKINQIMDFMQNLGLQMAKINDYHVEVTHNGVSKGTGLIWLTKKLNSSLEYTMGIGDSSNDLPMFEVVKHSYAMANGGAHVKKAAKHHTSSVEQNGLGEAIIDFMYREKLDR